MTKTWTAGFFVGATFTAGTALGGGVVFLSLQDESSRGKGDAAPVAALKSAQDDDREGLDEATTDSPLDKEDVPMKLSAYEVIFDGEVGEGDPETGGESVSQALERLELRYLALLAEQERLRADAKQQEEAEAREAALGDDEGKEAAAEWSQIEEDRGRRLALADLDGSDQPSDEPYETTFEAVGQNAPEVPNNYLTVTQVSPVYVIVPRDREPQRSPNKPVDRLGQQRNVLQPINTNTAYLNGRIASPWAPIDMSKHVDPWATGRVP